MHGLLRHGQTGKAAEELDRVGPLDALENRYSRGQFKFLRAELARQRGETWTDSKMEDLEGEGKPPSHMVAFYHQAVARQQTGCLDASRLREAARLCHSEAGHNRHNVAALFGWCFVLAAAAVENSVADWESARQEIGAFLDNDTAFRDHYGEMLSALSDIPKWHHAETILKQVPYL